MSEKTRKLILRIVLPAILGVALIVTAFWGNAQNASAEEYKRTLESIYTRNYTDLTDNMSNIESTLSKLMVVSSPQQYVLMLSDVWKTCGSAGELLSALPSSHVDTYSVMQFITRMGDYSHELTKRLLSGAVIQQEDVNQLTELHNACALIAQELRDKISDFDAASIVAAGYYDASAQEGENAAYMNDPEAEQQYPKLIYDGPFSESTEKAEPLGLGSEQVDEARAMQVASEFLGIPELISSGTEEGRIPAFCFSGTLENGSAAEICITKQGGQCLWWLASATGTAQNLPDENTIKQLSDKGKQYLADHDLPAMESTYAQYYEGVMIINYAATQGDVILYPDLIKVWFDLGNGEVCGIDARNYLFSHTQRDIPEVKLTPEEAQGHVTTALEILSVRKALIAVNTNDERLCYEFKGKFGEDSFIIYINAETGAEEEIFKIIDSENGQLVI